MLIISTYLAHLQKLTPAEALIKFEKGVNVVRKLESVGLSTSFRGLSNLGVDEVFSPKRKADFSVTTSPTGDRFIVSVGFKSPLLWFHPDGSLKLYGNGLDIPASPKPRLEPRLLTSYALQALRCVDANASTGWDIEPVPSMYKTPEDIRNHPYVQYAIIRKSNGVAWGPGFWGQLNLVDFSGAVYGIRLSREFKGIESFAGAMSPEAGEAYAARAVLTLKGCDQVSLLKSGTKMVTGNAMLGGTYYTATPRVRKIAAESIGVLAYEYTFGNDDFSLNGKHSVIHEVIIDAKSGDALRIQTPMPLGASSPAKTPPIPVPVGKIQLVVGGKKMGQTRLKIVATQKNVLWKDTVVQFNKRYLDAKWDGKSVLLINNQQYSISKIR